MAADRGVPFVLAGSLRNATATARRAHALAHGGAVGVIAAGERWGSASGSLRPAIEDLLGAGAVLAALDPSSAVSDPRCSPEAAAARAGFIGAKSSLASALATCPSGRELAARGWGDDVDTSARLDVSDRAAQMIDSAFEAA
jgi:2-phosphosulfolactate phosphatase